MKCSASRVASLGLIGLASAVLVACASTKPMGPVAPPPPPPPPPPPYATHSAPLPPPVNQRSSSELVTPGSARDFVINAGDRVYFDFDRYDVREEGRSVLDAQAAWLVRYPAVRVRIEGNCDELGTREYNFALGARRANSVRDYLVQHGVSTSRIETVSYGKEHPIDLGSGEEAQGHNRNAHTAITEGAR